MVKTRFRMTATMLTVGVGALLACPTPAAKPSDDGLLAEPFGRLNALIKPQAGESKWARVAWLTNLKEARERAVAEDKPLLLWRSGGGDVLGRT